jgi:alcohol dehydrogenase (cytochrome c)
MMKVRNRVFGLIGIVLLGGAAAVFYSGMSPVTLVGIVLNTFRSQGNPPGTLVLEARDVAAPWQEVEPGSRTGDTTDWPAFNRTLTSERFAPLGQINVRNVASLRQLCVFDTGLHENFQTGPLMVNGALVFTSAFNTYSIDPSTCKVNWQVQEPAKAVTPNHVNRGAAYLDGRVYRGTLDGRVVAYDLKSGARSWATVIANPDLEVVDAALIAWNGLVFAGVAQGDTKGVRGRMYALDASDGHIVWETPLVPPVPGDVARGPQGTMPAFQRESWHNPPDVRISGGGTWTSYTLDTVAGELYVPVGNSAPDFVESLRPGTDLFSNSVLILDTRTGNYVNHYQVIPRDWHDWDVGNTPSLFSTRGGRRVMALAPKDGYLYAYDRDSRQRLFQSAATRIENHNVPLDTRKEVHFCPGAVGGAEWNGVAYHPPTNLIFTGEDDWCTAVKLKSEAGVKAIPDGQYWMGANTANPLALMGTQDPHTSWSGWLYATDADTGEWKWRLKSNYPILSGITPTAGGLVFFGDMGGNLYAVDAASGKRLWQQKLAGAIGGGIITYVAAGAQKVAVAGGTSSIVWPTEQTTAKIVIFGLPAAAAN